MYDYTYYSNVLVHHGIKGQKHGERRYQNPDGSLTPAGRERYGVGKKKKSSLAASVKKAAADFTKGVKKTGKGVKKAVDKRKAAKLKEEQDKANAEREAWFKDAKSMQKHFGEMTSDERDRALKSMEQFDKMATYKKNSIERNLDLVNKGLKAMGVNGFNDLMQGATTFYNLTKTVNQDQQEKKKKIAEDAAKAAQDAKDAKAAEKEARKKARQEQEAAEKELRDKKERAKQVMGVMFKPKGGDGSVDASSYDDFKKYFESKGIKKNVINKVIAESESLSEANVKLADKLVEFMKNTK